MWRRQSCCYNIEALVEGVFHEYNQGTDGAVVYDRPICYTLIPKEKDNSQCDNGNERGAVMAPYTFEQDATMK